MSSGLRGFESKRRTIWRSAAALASAVAVVGAMTMLAPAASADRGGGDGGQGGKSGPREGDGPEGLHGKPKGDNKPDGNDKDWSKGKKKHKDWNKDKDHEGEGDGDGGESGEPSEYTLTLTKAWAKGTAEDDNAKIWIGGSENAVPWAGGTNADFAEGDTVTFGEDFLQFYETPTWSCVAVPGEQSPPSGEGFKSPSGGAFAPTGGKNHEPEPWSRSGVGWSAEVRDLPAANVACTITNMRQTTVVVHKQWVVTTGGNTVEYGPDVMPSGFAAELSLTGVASEGPVQWGQEYAVTDLKAFSYGEGENITYGCEVPQESVPTSNEGDLTELYTQGSNEGKKYKKRWYKHPGKHYSGVSLKKNALNEFTVTNEVTCEVPEVPGTTPGGSTPGGFTPLTPEPEQPAATPTEPEVEGVSQEKPAKTVKPKPEKVEVKGESATAAAPSANAKTGESVSYGDATGLALATGIIVLLGAARLRRRDEAA